MEYGDLSDFEELLSNTEYRSELEFHERIRLKSDEHETSVKDVDMINQPLRRMSMENNTLICPLCNRELPREEESKHHLIPKMKGGAKGPIVVIHRVCHTKIHSVLTEAECASMYNSIEMLKTHPDISKFIKWVSKKPPNFYDHSKQTNGKKKRK